MGAQPRQELVSGLDEQAKVEGGALREVVDVLEECAILGEIPVDEGHCRVAGRTRVMATLRCAVSAGNWCTEPDRSWQYLQSMESRQEVPEVSPQVRPLTEEERVILDLITHARTVPVRPARRARTIQLAATDSAVSSIAQEVQQSENCVRRWIKRFNDMGLVGLDDVPPQTHGAHPTIRPLGG